MSQRARSATAMPLADLIDTYGRSPRSKRGSAFAREHTLQVITQLGVPPDLRYLRDGFERTLKCIDAFGSVLDGCLRMVPGALSAAELAAELGTLLIWIDSQGWQATDPRLAKMARAASDAPHPLDGYCFFEHEPSARELERSSANSVMTSRSSRGPSHSAGIAFTPYSAPSRLPTIAPVESESPSWFTARITPSLKLRATSAQ